MSEPEPPVAPWEDFVLRLIAIYKFIKAILALALALALMRLIHHDIGKFLKDYVVDPLHLDSDVDSENHFLTWLFQFVSSLTPHTIRMSAWASLFYATVFAVEGFGLYLKKHWAEYMVLVVTGSFLPFEVYLMYLHLAWWKSLLIIGNVLIVVSLVHRIMLDYHNKKKLEDEQAAASPTPPSTTTEREVSEVP